MNFLVGTGGWGYLTVRNKPSLKTYSEIFDFVEVNYTFYQFPNAQMVESWRRAVPTDFTFSVRCHRDLTHKIGFRSVNEAYEIFYQTRTYCDILRSPYLILQTPPKYVIDQENSKDVKDFFSSLNLKGVKLVWEYRAAPTNIVAEIMQDFGIIECGDLSNQKPRFQSDVTYSRLFGKGNHNIYQFTDDELVEIDQKAQETNSKTVVLSYHGLRMNSDALRFKQYKKTGHFLQVTDYTGVESARAVLAEDAKFPKTKDELITQQGWKVIDLSKDKRVHLSELLRKIPNKTYSSLNEVIEEVKAVV